MKRLTSEEDFHLPSVNDFNLYSHTKKIVKYCAIYSNKKKMEWSIDILSGFIALSHYFNFTGDQR